MFTISPRVLQTYPGVHAGILLLRGVNNPAFHEALEESKRTLEEDLRRRFKEKTPQELESTPPLPAYTAYYRRFDKTYHVAGQLRSVVYKEKPIPSVAALVEAMFMAEIKNGLLTAGHDFDTIDSPLTMDLASGDESYTLMRGTPQTLKAGDLYIKGGDEILSSILYGPDQRTRIVETTHNAIFTVYAPAGIPVEAVEAHLNDLCTFVLLVSPLAVVEELKVHG